MKCSLSTIKSVVANSTVTGVHFAICIALLAKNFLTNRHVILYALISILVSVGNV